MEMKVTKQPLQICSGWWKGKVEIPMEAELLISDYQQPVFKVIKTIVWPVLLQKHVSSAKLALEGYLRCCVFYQSEDDSSLCRVEQKIPFGKTLELPTEKLRDEWICAEGKIQYSNCRATHPRRMELRGVYQITLSAMMTEEMEVVIGADSPDLQLKQERIQTVRLFGGEEKLFSCEGEVSMPEQQKGVLELNGSAWCNEIKALQEKAVIKGSVEARITWQQEEGRTETGEELLEFRQMLDVEQLEEGGECAASIDPIGWSLEEAEQGGKLTMTGLLHFNAWDKEQLTLAEDAFGLHREISAESRTIMLEEAAEAISETVSVELKESWSGGEPLLTIVQTTPLTVTQQAEFSRAGGEGTIFVFARNPAGELSCMEKSFEYLCADGYPCGADQLEVQGTAQQAECQITASGEQLSIRLKLKAQGILVQCGNHSVLNALQEGELYPPYTGASLHLYYAQPGESVFDIAKRFHTPADILMECNRLEHDRLEEAKKILIPQSV